MFDVVCVIISGIYVSLLESTAGESLSLLLKVQKEKADVDDVRRKMIDSAFYFIFIFTFRHHEMNT